MLKQLLLILVLIASLTFTLFSCIDDNSEDKGGEGTSTDGITDAEDESSGENTDDNTDSKTDGNVSSGETEDNESADFDGTVGSEDSNDNGETGDGTNEDSTNEDGTSEEDGTDSEVKYIYSINSTKYHLPTCYHTVSMNPLTKIEFCGTIEELVASGYSPCKSCKPDPDYDYENSDDIGEEVEGEVPEYKYVLNPTSHKFHLYGCASAGSMKEENKQYSNDSRDDLIYQGYSPCGNCNP